jgi:hypothetical protein
MSKRLTIHAAAAILCLCFSLPGKSQKVRYVHPEHDISIECTPNWVEEYTDTNGKEYFVTHPNRSTRVSMTFVADCHDPERFMKKASGLKGIYSLDGNFDTVLNSRRAMIMRGTCHHPWRSFNRVMVGIPVEDGLYLMVICCPEDCYDSQCSTVMEILDSVRIGV